MQGTQWVVAQAQQQHTNSFYINSINYDAFISINLFHFVSICMFIVDIWLECVIVCRFQHLKL